MPRPKVIYAFKKGMEVFSGMALFFAAMTIYLIVTSANDGQRVLSLVVGAIGLLLSLACGFFRMTLVWQRHEAKIVRHSMANIHYPLRERFIRQSGLNK